MPIALPLLRQIGRLRVVRIRSQQRRFIETEQIGRINAAFGSLFCAVPGHALDEMRLAAHAATRFESGKGRERGKNGLDLRIIEKAEVH